MVKMMYVCSRVLIDLNELREVRRIEKDVAADETCLYI